ncbi:MAG: LytTR family DNA-binding domain-containing protein [Ekhidna sp.]
MKILILEDEQPAGEKLMHLVRSVAAEAEIDWKRSIVDGVVYLKEQKVDLIFSDIELLDGNVFKLFDLIRPKCPIIFCTSYDTFYVDAFQTNGIAYLLKPYSDEDFAKAWDKYASLFSTQNDGAMSSDLIASIQSLISHRKTYRSTFPVKRRNGVFLLKVADIAYFQAQGDFVTAIDSLGEKHILNHSLSQMYEFVDPSIFFMINRSEIISFDHIVKYEPYTKNRLAITLERPAITLYTSNSRTPDFRNWLELR